MSSERRYETYWHRDEKGEWLQHPGLPRRPEDWQTLHAWVVRKVFLPTSRHIGAAGFAQIVERLFTELYPLYVFTSIITPDWQAQLRKRLGAV